ncbi:MAG: preprotein translocase subunit YajC [Actinobacteria bacterium]|jgi:preprotein translocase subunit YajC|nr:MAG: preprotein translocase subunit YajC [Actinomycetota bacterium]
MYIAIYLVVLVAAFFFFIVRPQRQRMAAHRALIAKLDVGDEVITSSGIHGTVRALDDETVQVEIAPGVVITIERWAIGSRIGAAFPDAESDAA